MGFVSVPVCRLGEWHSLIRSQLVGHFNLAERQALCRKERVQLEGPVAPDAGGAYNASPKQLRLKGIGFDKKQILFGTARARRIG
jgi:hypothetical protein